MPIIRYQLRNEYGLADPELYGSADKEDPEALLDGVAMAGLVGVLRQLGDLAEFAAEIFHNLHEEVMITAARGHALLLRVQQMEVDVPAIERNFLSQTTQSPLSHDTGIDWHPNLQIDENLITQVDMPRFVLDSYEESRGPPRLFMLDKFDIAGDGACLKRYSDPSFFKIKFTTSGKMEPDIQREKRSRKNKKKVLHRRNGETPESHRLVHMNSELKKSVSEKTPENQPVKRVKLKIRQLNDSSSIINSYMELVVGKQSPEYADFSGNSTSQSQLKLTRKQSSELAPAIREVIMDNSIDRPFLRERNGIKPSNKEEQSVTGKEEILLDVTDSQREKKELFQKTNDDAERSLPTFTKNQKDLFFDTNNKREDDADANSRTNDSLDGYVSDAAASELDTYLDALTTMDSGIETDNEIGPKPISNLFVKDFRKMDSNKSEGKELMSESLGSHIFTESSAKHSLSNDKESRTPNEDSSNSLTDSVSHDGLGVLTVTLRDLKTHENETHDTESDYRTNRELTGDERFVNSIQEHMKVDVPIPLSTLQVKSSTCCLADATSTHNLSASLEEFDSATLGHNTLSNDIDALETSGIHLEDEYGPTVNSHISEAPEDTHSPSLLNEIDCCADVDKALGGTIHKRSGEWETTFSNNCLTSDENPDNFTNDLMQLVEERSKNLPVQIDPSLAAPKIVTCTEELEGILSKPNVSDHFQVTRGTVDEVFSTTSDEESSLPLSLNNGELHAPVCQGSEVDTGENASPGASVIPIDNTSLSMLLPDGLPGAVESVVSSNENVDSTRTHVGPKDAACLSENKVACKENAGSFSENENTVYDNSLTALSFKTEVLQESCKLDEVYVTHELLPNHEQLLSSVSHVSNSLTALSFKNEVLEESCKLDEVDVPHEQLPNHERLLSSVSIDVGRNSFLVRERRDLFLPTEDQLDFCNNVAPFISPMELPQSESCSPHSVIECAKIDELPSGDVNFKECSCLNIDHEEHISYVSASEQKEFVTGESCPKDSVTSDVELIPEIAVFEEEHVLASGHLDSVHTENIVDASSGPECGDHSHVCHTEQFELVEEKLETAVSTSATSSVEMEDGKLKKTILQNEPDLFVSRMDDFLENIEECNSENQTGAHEHQYPDITSLLEEESDAIVDPGNPKCGSRVLDSFDHMGLKPASLPAESEQMLVSPQRKSCDKMLVRSFEEGNSENQTGAHEDQHPTSLLQEESDAVVDPGNPKSGRHVLDSFDHMGLKSVSVPAESKQVLAISPQSKRCDKMLLGTFDVSNVEPVKQSGIDVHMLEFKGNTECRSVNQPTPHSEALASSHHRLTINDDLFISEYATSESICPSEVSLPCDESDEISLLQKLGNLSLSGTQFEKEQPPEQDNNFYETHGQSIVVEAEEYSVDALSSDMIYQPDVTSAGATCLNPPEKAADSPLQSSYGIPVTSITDVAQTLPSLGAFNRGMVELQSSEVPLDEDPPLPPLPPLQWIMGKHRPSSMMKVWEMFRPQHEADKMTTMLPMDHQCGQTVMQQTNPHLLAQLHPNGDDQLGYLASEDESIDASKPSTLSLSTQDKKCQDDSFASGVQMKAHSVNSLPLVPFEEYYHQNQKHPMVGKMPQIGFTSRQTTLELTDMRSQHFPGQSEGESTKPLKSSASQSTSVHETEFSHGPANLETAAIHASNPFLSLSPTEGESCNYGVLEGKSVRNLETAAMHPSNPFSSSSCTECSGHGVHGDRNSLFMDVDESPPQEFLIPEEGNIQAFSFPAAEHARSNGRPRSLLNRPRDPLIEEVASHDKSTLRRVSELVRPSTQPEGERNTLLDQIKNKTFNLKPALVAKPNMEAPPTNLKVAAILERANAIRQAFVGSDEEDDDEGGWSDS